MARIRVLKNRSPRDLIIRKAAVLFRKKGYTATTMRELAESIGIEAPSLYNHIGSKSDLLREICFKISDQFNDNLTAIESARLHSSSALESIIRFHISIMINASDEVYVANHEWKQLPDPALSGYFQLRKNYENKVRAIIESGIKKGELKNMNPVVVMLTILSALRGIESWNRIKKNITQEELENTIVNHLLTGIIK